MANYRVQHHQTIGFGPDAQVTVSTKWEGASTDQLSRLYPPSTVFGADPLEHSEIEDGFIRSDFTFEVQTSDGSWKRCVDPRRRITPLTTLEQAIDAENRRDFPGDYGDYCINGHQDCDDCEPLEEEEFEDQPWECDFCTDGDCQGQCRYEDLILGRLKVRQIRDDCTTYDLCDGNYLIVQGERRVGVSAADFRADARPLHWLREFAQP